MHACTGSFKDLFSSDLQKYNLFFCFILIFFSPAYVHMAHDSELQYTSVVTTSFSILSHVDKNGYYLIASRESLMKSSW